MLIFPLVAGTKKIGSLHLLLDYDSQASDADTFVRQLITPIKSTAIGYAGYLHKQDLAERLLMDIFGEHLDDTPAPANTFDTTAIVSAISSTISACYNALPQRRVNIYFFPTILAQRYGATGFCPWHGTLLIYGNPRSKNMLAAIQQAVAHEYHHSVALRHHDYQTTLAAIVFEGFAERFSKEIVGGKRTPWSHSLSRSNAQIFLKKHRRILNKIDVNLTQEILFGSKRFKAWTGYSCGYWLADTYRAKHPEQSWTHVIKKNPDELALESEFLK